MSPRPNARANTREHALSRVRKLMALALDRAAAENESRNAAVQACKLIAELSLLELAGPTRPFSRPDDDAVALAKLKREYNAFRSRTIAAQIELKEEADALKRENVRLLADVRRLNGLLIQKMKS